MTLVFPWQTLLIAFFGALIGAALSYHVRKTLDEKAQQRTEKKLAYVHFVQASDMVAIRIALTSIFTSIVPSGALDKLKGGGNFTPSHLVCVKVAKLLREKDIKDGVRAALTNSMLSILVQGTLENFTKSELSPDQLSKLPERGVKDYVQFSKQLQSVQYLLKFISRLGSDDSPLSVSGDDSWITPEFLLDQWMSLERFSKHLDSVRSTLGVLAGVTGVEASALLKEQLELSNAQILESFNSRSALAEAAAAVEKESLLDSGEL